MVVAIERGLSRAFGLERAGSFVKQRSRALGWLLSIGLLLGLSVAAAGALGGASGALLEASGISGTPARVSGVVAGLLVSFLLDVGLLVLINLAAQLLILTASIQAELVLGPPRRGRRRIGRLAGAALLAWLLLRRRRPSGTGRAARDRPGSRR